MRQGHEDSPASGRDVETQEYKERFCANCGNKLPGVTTPSDVDFCLYCRGRGQHRTQSSVDRTPEKPTIPEPHRAPDWKEWGEFLEVMCEEWGLSYWEAWMCLGNVRVAVVWETMTGAHGVIMASFPHSLPWMAHVEWHDDGTVRSWHDSGEMSTVYWSLEKED